MPPPETPKAQPSAQDSTLRPDDTAPGESTLADLPAAAETDPFIKVSLFSAFEKDPSDPAAPPPDVQEAMNILSGGLTMGEDGEIVPLKSGEENPLAPEGAHERLFKGMLKKEETAKAVVESFGFEVHAFDLANPEDAVKYGAILNRFGEAGSKWQLEESAPVMVIDPNSPRGFRSIVTVKTFQTKRVLPDSVLQSLGMEAPPATPADTSPAA